MEGNKRVDELMLPVLNAINRHVKDREAKTDIYNRAYEALLISMEENAALREQVRWRKYPEETPEFDKLYWTDYGWCKLVCDDIWEDIHHVSRPVKWYFDVPLAPDNPPQPPEAE